MTSLDHQHARIEEALCDYAEWRNQMPASYWKPVCSLAAVKDYGTKVSNGFAPHIETIGGEAVICKPDGGMSNYVERHERLMRVDRISRIIEDAVPFMPGELRQVLEATYHGQRLDVPRTVRDAAARMEISVTKYQRLRYGLLCWLQGVTFKAEAVHLDDDDATIKNGSGVGPLQPGELTQ